MLVFVVLLTVLTFLTPAAADDRDACLRTAVDFGQPMPEHRLLALEAACHPLAAPIVAAAARAQRYRPLEGFPVEKPTLGEELYGPRPVAAPR